MNESDALHTAARAYVIDRSRSWTDSFDRTRRDALEAILAEIERSVPGHLGSLERTREQLITAARAGWSKTMEGIDLRRNAMRAQEWSEELESVIAYVRDVSTVDLSTVEELPYRRTLADDEAEDLRRRFIRSWRFDPGDTRFARIDHPYIEEFLHTRFLAEGGDEHVRRALLGHGLTRVLMLCRDSACHRELDLSWLRWEDDTVWFDVDLDWFVGWGEIIWHVPPDDSGDDVLAVGGWLRDALRSSWPTWREAVRQADWT